MTKRKNILVTGGMGFLGKNLVRNLLEENHFVIVADNFLTSDQKSLFEFQNYLNKDLLKFHPVDVSSQNFGHMFRYEPLDEIYHLASPASPPKYSKYWRETMTVNTQGTKNCLEIARTNKARVLFASSSEVYGQPLEVPQKESYYGNRNSFGNRSCYDESKALGETYCFQYIKHYNLDVRIARIHNTYGPYMNIDDGRVVTSFISSVLNNKPLKIFGSGNQYRCFTYVDDMVNGLKTLMDSTVNWPVNIGSHFKYSVVDLANKILELTNSTLGFDYCHIDKDDPAQRYPDLSTIETLGWKAEIPVEEGLKRTIQYFKEVL